MTRLCFFMLMLLATPAVQAAELFVVVKNIAPTPGKINCVLYDDPASFPKDPANAKGLWMTPKGSEVTCHFKNIRPGTYAVAVFHDVNGNRKMDTNFIGIPVEDVAVSNNVHPKFRAPTFDEAKFKVVKRTRAEILLN